MARTSDFSNARPSGTASRPRQSDLDASDSLVAVLDVDSDQPSAFDEDDARGLERIVGLFSDIK